MNRPCWLQQFPERDAFSLSLHIQPNAKQTAVVGIHGQALKIRLQARPVEGAANQALVTWLADFFAVPQRQVHVKQGALGRHKVVEVQGSRIDPQQLWLQGD